MCESMMMRGKGCPTWGDDRSCADRLSGWWLFLFLVVGGWLAMGVSESVAKQTRGFDYQEATDMIALCIGLNGTGDDSQPPAPPGGWHRLFPAPEEKQPVDLRPFDNAWELWQQNASAPTFAIVVRGTVPNRDSIVEDLLATMLDAQTALSLENGEYLPLTLAETQGASTHVGFTWGMAILLFHKDQGILSKLLSNTMPAGSRILITGHSQGAAVATLIHSFLYYAQHDSRYAELAQKNFSYQSYVFAQPKPGNWQYGQDFARTAAYAGGAFCVINDHDWVPQVPLTFELLDDVTESPVRPFLQNHLGLGWLARLVENFAHWLRTSPSHIAADLAQKRTRFLADHIDKRYVTSSGKLKASPSLNYAAACGTLISLRGDPGANPNDPNDPLWQHHAATYSRLLDQVKP